MTKANINDLPARILRGEIDAHLEQLGDFLSKQSETSMDLFVVQHGDDFLSRLPSKNKKSELAVSIMGARIVAKDVAIRALNDFTEEYTLLQGRGPGGVKVVPVCDAILGEFRDLYAFKRLYDFHFSRLVERYS